MGFLDYRKQAVRELGINPNDCSFSPGVFVADIDEWKKQKITVQLEKWMSKNFKWALNIRVKVFNMKTNMAPPIWFFQKLSVVVGVGVALCTLADDCSRKGNVPILCCCNHNDNLQSAHAEHPFSTAYLYSSTHVCCNDYNQCHPKENRFPWYCCYLFFTSLYTP